MSAENFLVVPRSDAKESRADRAIRLLTAEASNPFNEKLISFRIFYPSIVIAKKNGLKNKQIMKILAEGGLKLYPAVFEKLMNAMGQESGLTELLICGAIVRAQPSPLGVRHEATQEMQTSVDSEIADGGNS
jgi:hypothetical protein